MKVMERLCGAVRKHGVDPTRGHSVVYYLRRGDGNIKIGWSLYLAERMRNLREHHGDLDLLAVEDGDWAAEQARHRQFGASRISRRREWFRPSPDLLAHIRSLDRGA